MGSYARFWKYIANVDRGFGDTGRVWGVDKVLRGRGVTSRFGWSEGTERGNCRILLGMLPAEPTTSLRRDVFVLSALAALVIVVHFLMGNGYGFHRDELQFLDDARHLQWGFVAYPPMTSFFGRVAIALFGISLQVFRLPAALVNAVSLVLAGLMARELGGGRAAQIVALLLGFPLALTFSSVLQYNTFDLLAWSILILSTAHVLRTGDERFWLGAGLGLGWVCCRSMRLPSRWSVYWRRLFYCPRSGII